ncbi:hypothetical protein [Ferruginibacter profundus]
MKQQPWIGNRTIDVLFILLPPFVSLLIIFLFPQLFRDVKAMPDAGWVILILLIDVAHVYTTLFRTYFDAGAFKKQRFILSAIPFVGFIAGVMAYSISSIFFWRLLAYVAVFHFIRQQYGFMRVYSRKEITGRYAKLVDTVTIYYATIYPVAYWHLKGPRNFNWFTDNDFVYFNANTILNILTVLYFITVLVFIAKEIYGYAKSRRINIPKLAVVTGTLVSWYFGIVYFNGDMAFTILNVVSHGIPYMALIWIYGRKNYQQPQKGNRFLKIVFSKYGILIFLALIFLFAFVEEGLWDFMVWKEHSLVFNFSNWPAVNISNKALSFIVPLLALPQITHYILDGFIWKIKEDNFKWNNENR